MNLKVLSAIVVVCLVMLCHGKVELLAEDNAKEDIDRKLKKYEKQGNYKKVAKLLTQNAETRGEKIKILYNYIRQIITHPGEARHAHSPTSTMVTKTGTCLNQSILLFKMLKVIKEKPYYCWVHSGSSGGHIFVLLKLSESESREMFKLPENFQLIRAGSKAGGKVYFPMDTMDTFGKTGSYDYDKKQWKSQKRSITRFLPKSFS